MKNNNQTMKDIGEFGFIRSIQEACHFSSSKPIKGIGDDCAVIGPYEGKVLLISTDLLLEDVHFVLNKIRPKHLGEKAVCVNLSDIAAMGGNARHIFVSLAVPKQMSAETIFSIYDGIKNICREYGVNILGGDTSASPDRLMINLTVIGEANEKELLYRSGARPGDKIYVTGNLGNSAAGLMLIMEKASAPEPLASALIEAHNRPIPFLEAGKEVARSGLASAMIDLSDGVTSDLQHICESSMVGARLIEKALPISDELKAFAKINRFDPFDLALSGGEDYKLLITVPKENTDPFEKLFEGSGLCPIFHVGEITENKKVDIIMRNGNKEHLKVTGYDHFTSPSFSLRDAEKQNCSE